MELNRETIKKLMLLVLYTIAVLSIAFHLEQAFALLRWMLGLLFPFLFGAAIAFVLNVPMRFIERHMPLKDKNKLKRSFSLMLAIIFVAMILGIVIFLVLPQLADTLMGLKDSVPVFFSELKAEAEKMFSENPEIARSIESIEVDWKSIAEKMAAFITSGAGDVLSQTVTAAMSIASGVTTFMIAFIFAIYILLQKEILGRQFKKVLYAYFPLEAGDEFLRISSLTEKTFSKFMAGQCMEAVILGLMFFITLSIFHIPYALLVGVLIAFTALIPIFGAFIGCAVGVFLIFMVNPIQAFWFIIIFFVLQQIEGNLIYPYVVGNSVGLPAIWVLVAVTLGGSMMGIVGMLIFIPVCSVAYSLLREDTIRRIEEKRRKADLAVGIEHGLKKTGQDEKKQETSDMH